MAPAKKSSATTPAASSASTTTAAAAEPVSAAAAETTTKKKRTKKATAAAAADDEEQPPAAAAEPVAASETEAAATTPAAAPKAKAANPFADMTQEAVLNYVDEVVNANVDNLKDVKTGLSALRKVIKKATSEHSVLNTKIAKLETELNGGGGRRRRSAAAKDDAAVEKKKRNVGGFCVISEALANYLGISDPETLRPRGEVNTLVFRKIAEEGPASKLPKLDANGNPVLDSDGNPVPNGKTLRYDSNIGKVFGGEEAIKAKLGDRPFTGFNVNVLLTSHIFTRKAPVAPAEEEAAE